MIATTLPPCFSPGVAQIEEQLELKSVSGMNSIATYDSDESDSVMEELPQAHQAVTSHDRLWAELETLDRDAEQAKIVQERRDFLGTEHAEKLADLRIIQIQLAEEMTREEASIDSEHYHELWSIGDPDELYHRLYDDKHFDLLNDHVVKISEKLDEIAAIIDASEMNQERTL